MNPRSATALSWAALIVDLLGLMALTAGGQFMGAAAAVVLALVPAAFSRGRAQLFAGAVLVLSFALAVAGYSEFLSAQAGYTARAKLQKTLAFARGIQEKVESACADGTFASKRSLSDIGLPGVDAGAAVLRAELHPVSANTVRLKLTLAEISGSTLFGLAHWSAVPQGSAIEFDLMCSPEKKLASTVTSNVEPKYLPARLRK